MIYLISVLFFINILNSQVTMENTIHQFKVEDIYGDVFDFSNLKGKKIMIVNTASKCGLTPQYEKLQSLHEKYGDEKFINRMFIISYDRYFTHHWKRNTIIRFTKSRNLLI